MLNVNVEKILNEQVEKEGYSSNLYLAMASWANNNGYKGVSDWLFAQADEERLHMLKFINYINDRGGRAVVPALKQPPVNYQGIKELFNDVYNHEQFISESVNEIVAVTVTEKDYTTHNWIQWFVTEQLEEEAAVSEIIDKLKLIGDNNMYLFDRDIFGMRATTTPV